MRKIREVLRLKYELGFTHRMIAKALRVAVGTVSEYLAKAKKGGLSFRADVIYQDHDPT